MKIIKIISKNFNGTNVNIFFDDYEGDELIIFGQNSSGKTNLLKSLMMLFDKSFLSKIESKGKEIFDEENEYIFVAAALEIEKGDILTEKGLNYPNYIDNNIVLIAIKLEWNKENNSVDSFIYEEKGPKKNININILDEIESWDKENKWKVTKSFEISSKISILYLPPIFDLEKNKKIYLKNIVKELESDIVEKKKLEKEFEQIIEFSKKLETLDKIIIKSEKKWNEGIAKIKFISETKNIKDMPMEFLLENSSYEDIGDGFNRFFSIIFQIEAEILMNKNNFNKEKRIIILLEEPENNFSILWQRKFIDEVRKRYPQIIYKIISTHSPNQINMQNDKNIFLKMEGSKAYSSKFDIKSFNKSKHLNPLENISVANSIFFKNVLIVEGISEEIFYNFLYENNSAFRDFINEKELFILVARNASPNNKNLKFFKDLRIKVGIKIDNDKNKEGEEFRINNVCRIEEISIDEDDKIDKLFKKGYFFSEHNLSFEGDIKEFVDRLSSFNDKFSSNQKDKLERIRYLIKNPHFQIAVSKLSLEELKKNIITNFINYYV